MNDHIIFSIFLLAVLFIGTLFKIIKGIIRYIRIRTFFRKSDDKLKNHLSPNDFYLVKHS